MWRELREKQTRIVHASYRTQKIQLVLRFPAPDRRRSRIERNISLRYLTEIEPVLDAGQDLRQSDT